jgi:hypothetical protein
MADLTMFEKGLNASGSRFESLYIGIPKSAVESETDTITLFGYFVRDQKGTVRFFLFSPNRSFIKEVYLPDTFQDFLRGLPQYSDVSEKKRFLELMTLGAVTWEETPVEGTGFQTPYKDAVCITVNANTFLFDSDGNIIQSYEVSLK